MTASWCCHYRQRLLLRLWTFTLRTNAIPSIPITTAIDSGFTQQNIVVDIDDVERDMEIWNGKGSLKHWCRGNSKCCWVISIFRYYPLIQQHKQTYLFLSYFSSPVIIQTNSILAWEVVQKYVHWWTRNMKPLCHWFINSLPFRTQCSSHGVITIIIIIIIIFFFNDAVGWWQFHRHTVSTRYQVFDLTCIALWVSQWIFPILKQKQAISYSGANWRVVHANQELDLPAV